MTDKAEERKAQEELPLVKRSISRRDFLKYAGATGAAIGLSTGLGSLVAACADEEEPSGTTGSSVSTGAEMGREIKIGWVTMTTGIFAGLSEPDDFLLQQAEDTIGDGLVCADGKKHPIKFIRKDGQSDPNRAAEVAGELITGDNPDIVFAGMTPVVNVPVGSQCEVNGVPCVTYGCPMEPWFFSMPNADPAVGFKWAYNVFWSIADLNAVYIGLFEKITTNKKVACLWANDPDGQATADPATGFTASLEPAGYTWVNPGLVTSGTEDFSSAINQFKAEGCECLTVLMDPPDFANFWKQAKQQGWIPKVTAIGRAILTRPDMDAIGDIGNGLSNEVWWENAKVGTPFSPALGLTGGAGFDVVTDVVKRTVDLDDPQSYVEAIKATKLDTLVGPVEFANALPNCALTPLVGGQWIGKTGDWVRKVVDNSHYPDIPQTGEIVDLTTL
jgi:branched-chain amino acid transport system substrate-binding protein